MWWVSWWGESLGWGTQVYEEPTCSCCILTQVSCLPRKWTSAFVSSSSLGEKRLLPQPRCQHGAHVAHRVPCLVRVWASSTAVPHALVGNERRTSRNFHATRRRFRRGRPGRSGFLLQQAPDVPQRRQVRSFSITVWTSSLVACAINLNHYQNDWSWLTIKSPHGAWLSIISF